MAGNTHYTIEQFLKAIENSGGYVSLISDRVGCHISTLYEWKDKHPEIQKAIDSEKIKQVDFAEGKLQSLIKKENPTAIIFYLKTQGRDRGYVERQDIDITSKDEKIDGFKVVVINKEPDDT
jgi:hypothetical protein